MIKKAYTTNEAAYHCNVSFQSVIKWVESGKLKAYKTPGGHRRILLKDFMRFLEEHKMPPVEDETEDNIRVIIADDDETIVRNVTEILKKNNRSFDTRATNDIFEVGRMLASFNPEIVILGATVGGASGFDICKKIKNGNVTQKVKVLMVVETSEDVTTANSLAVKAVKIPVDYDELVSNIEKLLR